MNDDALEALCSARLAERRAARQEARARYYAENRERIRATAREKRRGISAAARERERERERAAYRKNPGPARASSKRWAEAHPQATRASVDRYQALRRGAAIGERVYRAKVWERDGGTCHLCGLPCDPAKWHLDHIVPLSRGGEHSYANVAVSHPSCNVRKGARLL